MIEIREYDFSAREPERQLSGRAFFAVDDMMQKVFRGSVFIVSGLEPMQALIKVMRRLAKGFFPDVLPVDAHRCYPRADFFQRAHQAQEGCRADSDCRKLFTEALLALGFDGRDLFQDTIELRIAPPVKTHDGSAKSHLPPHRDTWGVGWQQQVNWWAPLWPLTARRTIGFFPDYWWLPLANTSAHWSLGKFSAAAKVLPPLPDAYPSVPQATELPKTKIHPVVIRPKELLCFSSAHLHGSVVNTTAQVRYSFETRTLRASDIKLRMGAPNMDCLTRKAVRGLHVRAMDGARLKEVLP